MRVGLESRSPEWLDRGEESRPIHPKVFPTRPQGPWKKEVREDSLGLYSFSACLSGHFCRPVMKIGVL